ncbi:MAG: family 20 glycosylhydrolase [Bacteroidales bacterium]|nr:family 20 glycosylhydrolase [Bacteroidales bacterium]
MKYLSHLLLSALSAFIPVGSTAGGIDFRTVPLPHSIALTPGDRPFSLTCNTIISAADSLSSEAAMLESWLPIATAPGARPGVISLRADLYDANPEAYTIEIAPDTLTINGASAAATFYGVQTLRKALAAATPAVDGSIDIPTGRIYDYPRFGYRGMHFDVARHFFPVDSVKSYLDMMALHGLNRFHWHLTDDQGWRVEIKSRPRLTEVGSRREGTIIGRTGPGYDGIPVEGYYSQQEIADIIAYAARRHITVIPEIDLPSHMQAALASYPELGCTGGPYEVWQRWGISPDVLCPGNDETMRFLDDVISEVATLFPGPNIHIGGDECPRTRWEECPKCQKRIRDLRLEDRDGVTAEARLQGYVTEYACDVARRHGKRAIGWDEILESNAPDDAVVMSWHSVTGGLEGVRRGHQVIMTPSQYCYFDYFQSPDGPDEPFAVGGLNGVDHVYSLEPVLPDFSDSDASLVLGCQANLWTEYVRTLSHAQYNVLPRMAALSEVAWTAPELKDYEDFRRRLLPLMAVYDSCGYNYARHVVEVAVDFEPDAQAEALVMTCSALPGYSIRYTLDGSEPTPASTAYTVPVSLRSDCVIKVNAFSPEGRPGRATCDTLAITPLTFGICEIVSQPYYVYAFKGAPQLVDGLHGTKYFRTGRWLGFSKSPLDATVTMRRPAQLSSVTFRTVVKPVDALADAASATLYGLPAGSDTWIELASETYPPDDPAADHHISTHTLSFEPRELSAIRLVAEPVAMLPPEHPQGGWPALMFVDEISAR